MFQMIFRNVLVLLITAASSVTIAFASDSRVALVIGNSDYRHAPALANPKNDAADMAAAAETLGFKVIKGLDLDKSGMDRTIREFAEALQGASVGMFFYAGHGLQVSGKNYLVPIDAELKTAEALDFEMVGLDVVQRVMENATETNILFVDACRDNPLARNLARAMGTRSAAIGHGLTAQEAGAGTLISFSTQPGNVALDGTGNRNSPYAGALAKHITTQGKGLPAILVQVRRDVMAATEKRQVPWEHSALTAEVVLAPQASSEETTGSELKTAKNETSESVTEPTSAKQRVVKIGPFGKLKIINNKNPAHLYNRVGEKIPMGGVLGAMPMNETAWLPKGRYYLKNGGGWMIVALEIAAGEDVVVDFKKHLGSLRIINNKLFGFQHLFDKSGEKRIRIGIRPPGIQHSFGIIPDDTSVELPPGFYQLKNRAGQVTVEEFEIKAGEEVVIDFGGG